MQDFFACGSPAPVRVEREGGADAWFWGTLAVPSVQGHRLPPVQELWPYWSLFSLFLSLCSWRSDGLFGQYFSVVPPVQAFRGLPCLGPCSVDRRISH